MMQLDVLQSDLARDRDGIYAALARKGFRVVREEALPDRFWNVRLVLEVSGQ